MRILFLVLSLSVLLNNTLFCQPFESIVIDEDLTILDNFFYDEELKEFIYDFTIDGKYLTIQSSLPEDCTFILIEIKKLNLSSITVYDGILHFSTFDIGTTWDCDAYLTPVEDDEPIELLIYSDFDSYEVLIDVLHLLKNKYLGY